MVIYFYEICNLTSAFIFSTVQCAAFDIILMYGADSKVMVMFSCLNANLHSHAGVYHDCQGIFIFSLALCRNHMKQNSTKKV